MSEFNFPVFDHPSICISADQWGEDGYVLFNGRVHSYTIDRKEGQSMLSRSWGLEDFLADGDVSGEAKAWVKEKR